MSRPVCLRWIPLAFVLAVTAANLPAQPPASPLPAEPPISAEPPVEIEQTEQAERKAWQELFQIGREHPEQAVELIETRLQTPELTRDTRARLLAMQALFFDRLGRTEDAAAAREKLLEQVTSPVEPDGTEDEGELERPLPTTRSLLGPEPLRILVTQPWLLPTGVAIVFGLMLAGSRRQSRVGRGSFAGWIGVSLVFTALALLPLGTALAIHWLLPGRSSPAAIGFAAEASGLSVLLLIVMNLRPLHEVKSRAFPEITEGPLLDRVAELSLRMGVPTPRVRTIPSDGGELATMAFMSSVTAPTLLVTGGVLHRLQPEERDAILAHELGHIANLSLWWYAAIVPVSASVAVLTAMPRNVSHPNLWLAQVLFAAAVATGLQRIMSRVLEYDCDRRAAEATGHGVLASALLKIHVLLGLPDRGLMSWLIYSTATHPSRDERIDAIARRAPESDPVTVEWARGDIPRRRWAARCMTLAWLAVLGASLVFIHSGQFQKLLIAAAMLGAAIVVPPALIGWLSHTEGRWMRRRTAVRRTWSAGNLLTGISFGVMLIVMAVRAWGGSVLASPSALSDDESLVLPLVLAVAMIGFLVGLLLTAVSGLTGKDDTRIAKHLFDGEYTEALQVAAAQPRRKWAPVTRHHLAVCRAMTGDRERAREECRRLMDEERGPPAALVLVAALQLEDVQFQETLATAREYEALLPKDPLGPLMAAGALLELGELDAAWEAAERCGRLKPDEAQPVAVKGRVAVARGDLEEAARLLDEAEAMAPGDIVMERGRFDLAMREGDLREARVHLDRMRDLVTAAPLAIMGERLKRLERKLADALH